MQPKTLNVWISETIKPDGGSVDKVMSVLKYININI